MGLVIAGVLFVAYLVWLVWPEKKKTELPDSYFGKEQARYTDLPHVNRRRTPPPPVSRNDSIDDALLANTLLMNSTPSHDSSSYDGGSSYDSGSSDCGSSDSGGGDSGGGGCD